MKKRIGIMTIVKVGNYGAELQAFATLNKLRLLGYNDAELIDYLYYKTWKFKDTKLSVPFAPMGIRDLIIYILKYRVINWLVAKLFPLFNSDIKYRNERFDRFHEENSRFGKRYETMDELYKNPPLYDVYMAGSDQVWNPNASSSIEPYFLTFAPKDKKRVSYASSFGVETIDEALRTKYRTFLSGFDYISVREKIGCKLVQDLSGKHAEFVLDPTLLLNREKWMTVAKEYPNAPKQYVLIYQLSSSKTITALAQKISKERGIPILRISKRAYWVESSKGVQNIKDAGPAEFLSLIANAEFVLTNSFHGTAFSANFGIPFYTILSSSKKNNSRIESLLRMLDLDERILPENVDVYNVDTSEYGVNSSYLKLNEMREISELYLKKCLSDSSE